MSEEFSITDVSDTALWVANLRAREMDRPDALFRDPLARELSGERGEEMARKMKGSQYVAWTMVVRTQVIDELILNAIRDRKVDAVLNLGAGLDTRPYRLPLPTDFKWFEADFARIIEYKERHLRDKKATCRLERSKLDLTDTALRDQLLAKVDASAKNILVLTEGLIPYLEPEHVASLADALHGKAHLNFWVQDFFSTSFTLRVRTQMQNQMKGSAKFKFTVPDWMGFFDSHGWKPAELRYSWDESIRLNRPIPLPAMAKLAARFFWSREKKERIRRGVGYVMLERK